MAACFNYSPHHNAQLLFPERRCLKVMAAFQYCSAFDLSLSLRWIRWIRIFKTCKRTSLLRLTKDINKLTDREKEGCDSICEELLAECGKGLHPGADCKRTGPG